MNQKEAKRALKRPKIEQKLDQKRTKNGPNMD